MFNLRKDTTTREWEYDDHHVVYSEGIHSLMKGANTSEPGSVGRIQKFKDWVQSILDGELISYQDKAGELSILHMNNSKLRKLGVVAWLGGNKHEAKRIPNTMGWLLTTEPSKPIESINLIGTNEKQERYFLPFAGATHLTFGPHSFVINPSKNDGFTVTHNGEVLEGNDLENLLNGTETYMKRGVVLSVLDLKA